MTTTVDRVDRSIIKNPVRRTLHTATEAEHLLADIRALAPNTTAHVSEIETARASPTSSNSHGGLEFDLPTTGR